MGSNFRTEKAYVQGLAEGAFSIRPVCYEISPQLSLLMLLPSNCRSLIYSLFMYHISYVLTHAMMMKDNNMLIYWFVDLNIDNGPAALNVCYKYR